MKKWVCALSAAAMSVLLLAGCETGEVGSNPGSPAADSSSAGTAALSGKLVFAGSSSMGPVCDALTEAFKEANPNVTTEVGVTGSGAAITALSDGTAQIGNLSRAVKAEENAEGRFESIVIAKDGIAVVVNPSNTVSALTKQQIADIYTGKITNWKELGGADKAIYVIGRDASSGTRDGFEDILKIKGSCQYGAELKETGDVKQKVASDEFAIGYISFASVSDGVKALTVDGVAPSEATIADGSYSIQRPFVHAYAKGTTDPRVLAYLEFLKTDTAQNLIKAEKLVPNKFWE